MTDRIGKLRDTRTPLTRCPYCGYRLDAATAGDPERPNAVPKPGDACVCISCAQILVFDEQLRLRMPLKGEVEPTPALQRVQAAVRQLDRRKMRNR